MRYRRMRVAGGIYAFTVVTRDRWPIFGTDDAVALVLATLRHVQSGHPFELDAYVILPDHLHMIWTLPEDDSDFSTRWMLIKKAFTRRYKVLTNSAGGHGLHPSKTSTIWQNRFWEQGKFHPA